MPLRDSQENTDSDNDMPDIDADDDHLNALNNRNNGALNGRNG